MTESSNKQIWLAYAMGIASGGLGALILLQLQPERKDANLAQYEDVQRFVGDTFVNKLDDEQLVTRALKGLLNSLDPYSDYYDPTESKREEAETAGQYLGIGVVLRQIDEKQRVFFPMPESPAFQAGLQPGDEVVAVGGVATEGLPWSEISQHMRGPEGSQVVLDLRDLKGADRQVEVSRAMVPQPSVRHARILTETPDIGYLTVRTFSRRTATEFDTAVQRLADHGMRGLIVDLRGNRGGVMESAVHIADRFVSEGLLLRTESRGATEKHFAKPEATLWPDMPLAILVDDFSASASEILAGALQDHRRAALIGIPTYGKGMVQTIRTFGRYQTKAKVTSAYYYSPSGRLFERTAEEGRDYGIIPDVQIELSEEQANETMRFLEGFSVPEISRAAVLEWQSSESRELIAQIPRDPQLLAALDLFQGQTPTAQSAVASTPPK